MLVNTPGFALIAVKGMLKKAAGKPFILGDVLIRLAHRTTDSEWASAFGKSIWPVPNRNFRYWPLSAARCTRMDKRHAETRQMSGTRYEV